MNTVFQESDYVRNVHYPDCMKTTGKHVGSDQFALTANSTTNDKIYRGNYE